MISSREKTQRSLASCGFTMLELIVVVIIIAILGLLVLPRLSNAVQQSRFTATNASMRAFARGADFYHAQYGAYPADVSPGVVPAGLAEFIRVTDWRSTPPIGGRWDWNSPTAAFWIGWPPNISVNQSPAPVALWNEFDNSVDDGSLSTGQFRRRTNNLMLYLEN